MGFDAKIDGNNPSFLDRFNATLSGLGSGDTNIGELADENKFKNIASLYATNMQPPAQNTGSAFGWGYAGGSQDTGASNI